MDAPPSAPPPAAMPGEEGKPDEERAAAPEPLPTGYLYRGGLCNDDPGTTPLMADREWKLHNDGRNILRLDCSVRFASPDSKYWALVLPDEKPAEK